MLLYVHNLLNVVKIQNYREAKNGSDTLVTSRHFSHALQGGLLRGALLPSKLFYWRVKKVDRSVYVG